MENSKLNGNRTLDHDFIDFDPKLKDLRAGYLMGTSLMGKAEFPGTESIIYELNKRRSIGGPFK
jgi:hypothetical protein